MKYQITNQRDLRKAFWESHPSVDRKKHWEGEYACDTRCAFADYVDAMQRDGIISEALAQRATL